MIDEWEVDQLDLDAYLGRIAYDGPVDPTGRTLAGLHRAHVAAISFENLDLVLGRGIGVDLGSVQAKLVDNHRGGYCYEHGVLFAAVLERLGYSVDRLLARIGYDEQRPRPRTHMTLHVGTDTEQWLADVGFGAGLLEPLPWDETGDAHDQGGWTYQLLPAAPGSWQVCQRGGEEWTALYSFTEEPQHASDVEVADHFTSTHPSSPFVGQAVAMRRATDAQHRLRDRRLTTTRPDGATEERVLDDAEVATALRDDFGLSLSDDEIADLASALSTNDASPGAAGRDGSLGAA